MKRKIGSLVLSAAMAFYMVPATAFAAQSESSGDNATTVEGTPGVDYADGDVLVAVYGGQEALDQATQSKGGLGAMSSGNKVDGESFTVEEDLCSLPEKDLAEATGEEASSTSSGLGALSVKSNEDLEVLLLHGDDTASLIDALSGLDCVAYAEPNYFCTPIDGDDEVATATAEQAATASSTAAATASSESTTASSLKTQSLSASGSTTDPKEEPMYDYQWSLKSTGGTDENQQLGYKDTTGMDVAGAWDQGAGSDEEVVVAVVDSGVDYTHEDLKDNMWTGGDATWSKALGGGTYGFNACYNDLKEDGTYDHSDPMDINTGHGTHCASTIAASWNGKGIAGVNGKVKIMACRFLSSVGSENTVAGSVMCYNYLTKAKENGVNVVAVNNSWGNSNLSGVNSGVLGAMLYQAGEKGIITLFAAGNSGADNDVDANMSYNSSNPYVMTVGALTSASTPAYFSEWGERTVSVFAPGVRVLAGTTNYGANQDEFTSVTMDPQYTPWIAGTTSANSSYFMEDYESTTLPDDGISYSLVKLYKGYASKETVKENVAKSICVKDSNNGYLSDGYLKIPLSNAGLQPGDDFSLDISISAEKWAEIVAANKGDDLYFGCEGYIHGSDTSASTIVEFATAGGFTTDGTIAIGNRDYPNWFNVSKKQSISALSKGADSDGTVHIYISSACNIEGNGKTFSSNDYICIDKLSLGWAAYSRNSEGNVTDSYYYSDGTSMATPNATGVVSLLCSYAAAQTTELQDAATARKIVSYIKGGVTQLSSLESACSTEGVANANTSYTAFKTGDTSALHPVSEAITSNGDGTCTLTGSFFGSDKGSVTFDGTELTVTNWTDSAITFTTPAGKERSGRVAVTKDSDNVGYAYLTMPAADESNEVFSSLPVPDFQLTSGELDENGTKLTCNAKDLTVVRTAALDGYIYAYCISTSLGLEALLRYNIEEGTWDETNYLGDLATQLYYLPNQCVCQLAAGATELYLLAYDRSGVNKRLLTIDAATGAIKYDVALNAAEYNVDLGTLVLLGGQLCLFGGAKGGPSYTCLYPDTGEFYEVSETANPLTYIAGIATPMAAGVCVTGSFTNANMDGTSYSRGLRNNEVVIDNYGNVGLSEVNFYGTAQAESAYTQANQQFINICAAGTDTGAIITGPLSLGGELDVTDTWIYDITSDSIRATRARCYPTTLSKAAACTYNGMYYVLGNVTQNEGENMVLRCASLSDLGQTDTTISAMAADAQCSPEAISIEDAKVEIAPQTYTGEELYPEVTVTVTDDEGTETELRDGYDYEATCEKAIDAGTYEVTITGIGDYTGTATGEFVVEKAPSSVLLIGMQATYTGKPLTMENAVVTGSTGKVTYKYYTDEACTKEIASCINVGTYYVVASVEGDANHEGAVSKVRTFEIVKTSQTLTSKKTSKRVTVKAAKKGKKKGKVAKSKVVLKSITKTYGVTNKTAVRYELLTAGNAEGKVKVTKAGKVTVKKGLKKGIYTVRVLAKSTVSANYNNAPERTLFLRIVVK